MNVPLMYSVKTIFHIWLTIISQYLPQALFYLNIKILKLIGQNVDPVIHTIHLISVNPFPNPLI